MVKLEILHQCCKRVKTKSQKVLEANSYVCRSYRGKSVRGSLFDPPTPCTRNMVKHSEDTKPLWKVTKVDLSPSKKNCVICFIESPLKIMKNAFDFILKAFFFFSFRHDFLVLLEKKAWLENSWCHSLFNKHLQYNIAQYLMNYRQPDNETWSINRI